ncbi:protein-methionine-sulfoxide reductase heme-binding subunit MsrQ [Roseovarius sp. CAU 1744]|uniref:protein-methionine-sulfoxide reductase heme-binding subunit MsrQ n=1 Tax=Roseovarius sp. CAU 1744 TaxID=3140368 RepID=UPI00325B0541
MTPSDVINAPARRMPAGLIYIGSFAYAGWLLWLGIENRLGPNPVEALEHALGEAALYLLIAGLAVTPLRRIFGVNLLKFRRAIGLSCFFFVTLHLLTWAVLDIQALDRVWADIVKRPYITVGMVGFVVMVPLAATSNHWSVRRMGGAWRKLHRLTYLAAILGGVHYLMLVKGWQIRPMVFLAIIVGLLLLRLWKPSRRART